MTSRNIRSRIVKLEKSRKPTDEILVVWRRPGADVSEAITDVDYVLGDRVICLDWYSEGPPPAPRWRRDLRLSQSKEEKHSIDIMLKRILDTKSNQPAATERRGPEPDVLGYSDEDFWYILFGVPDGRMIRKEAARETML